MLNRILLEAMNYPKVSVIIPAIRLGEYIKEAIKYYEELDYPDFEIIIVVNEENFSEETLSKTLDIKLVKGPRSLSAKRDIGFEISSGEIIAFIDDDAFPRKDWLKNAVEIFQRDKSIGIVGGPALTPPNEPFLNKISGNIYSSLVMSGNISKRSKTSDSTYFEDNDIKHIHGVNLIVKREVFLEVNGFRDLYNYYSGEDNIFCLKVKKAGYKIIFSPNVVVYHHRRSILFDHFKQVANYGFHRGYFVRKFPEISLKLVYFLPSTFLLGVIFGSIISIFSPLILKIYLTTLGIYFLLAFISSIKPNPIETLLTTLGIFFSHIVYGFNFLKGLLFGDIIYRKKGFQDEYYKKKILSQKRFQR